MIRILLVFFILIGVSACSMSESVDDSEAFEMVEQMPALIGGFAGLQAKVKYPEIARRMKVEGRVIVQFIVDENGTVYDPSVVRGIGSGCDEEAVRVLKEHAKFVPGRQDGHPVKVKFSLPVIFKLS